MSRGGSTPLSSSWLGVTGVRRPSTGVDPRGETPNNSSNSSSIHTRTRTTSSTVWPNRSTSSRRSASTVAHRRRRWWNLRLNRFNRYNNNRFHNSRSSSSSKFAAVRVTVPVTVPSSSNSFRRICPALRFAPTHVDSHLIVHR